MNKYIAIALVLLLAGGAQLFAKWSIYTEAGLAFTGYNDVQIPNDDEHDKFSLSEDLKAEVPISGRINVLYQINPKHRIGLLYSPLTIKSTGAFDRDIRYRNTVFVAGEEVDATYRFDSYRLQYSYHFAPQTPIIKYVGASIKVRDAEIKLTAEGKTATRVNLGAVPLLSLGLAYEINEMLGLSMDAEGLGSPYGRALDALTAVNVNYNPNLQFRMGYRILEGGSDGGGGVYTFALIHYPTIGMMYRF